MCSVITNIYNKKTKGSTLMEMFTATGKLKKLFLFDNYRFSMCSPRVTRHTSIRYSTSCHTRVKHRSFLLTQTPCFSKLFILRTNCLVCRRILCVLCTKCTLYSNHRHIPVIFQHTNRLLPRSGHFLTTKTRIA